jgi:predicted nucleic acid-binding Zn ribbon protein
MASFCPKCGSALPDNEQICKSCGAAAATQATNPAKSGSSAVKIILIIVAVIAVLGILVLGAIGYVGYRISRSIHTGPDGQMTLQTPEGKVNLNTSETFTAAELGTDPYPGAQATRGGMKMNLPGGSMVMGSFLTSDSKQQVIDFYKARFGGNTAVMDTADGAIITMPKSKQESVMVTVTANPSRDSGKTRITITHTINTKTP